MMIILWYQISLLCPCCAVLLFKTLMKTCTATICPSDQTSVRPTVLRPTARAQLSCDQMSCDQLSGSHTIKSDRKSSTRDPISDRFPDPYRNSSVWRKFTQIEHARQETVGSNEIPVISWQQYSDEWIQWPDLFGFCRNRQEPATTDNCIRSLVHCIGFLPFSDGVPVRYCTFPSGLHGKCMEILLPGNIDLGT